MESLRLRADENTFSLLEVKPFLRDIVKLNMRELPVLCVCVCFCEYMFMCSGQVTMERVEPFANISYFNPQQSVLSTRTQLRINKRRRGGKGAWQEKTPKYGYKRKRKDVGKTEKFIYTSDYIILFVHLKNCKLVLSYFIAGDYVSWSSCLCNLL